MHFRFEEREAITCQEIASSRIETNYRENQKEEEDIGWGSSTREGDSFLRGRARSRTRETMREVLVRGITKRKVAQHRENEPPKRARQIAKRANTEKEKGC